MKMYKRTGSPFLLTSPCVIYHSDNPAQVWPSSRTRWQVQEVGLYIRSKLSGAGRVETASNCWPLFEA